MYNIGHDVYYLDYYKRQNLKYDYEFACQTRVKNVQRNASHFLIDLSSTNVEQRDDINESNKDTPKTNSFIAGIFFCTYESFSEQLKDKFYHSLVDSIYYKNQQYLEAFKNCLQMLQSSFDNCEINSQLSLCKQKLQRRSIIIANQKPLVTANLILKLNNDIYISKSLNEFDKIENICFIQREGLPSVIQLDPLKDLIKYSEECYKIKEETLQASDHILLTDSLTLTYSKIFAKNLTQIYPIDPKNIRSGHYMHFIKIQII